MTNENKNEKNTLTHIGEFLRGTIDDLRQSEWGGDRPAPFIPTGIPALDGMIGGFRDGSLTIIGSRPGMGKTTFLNMLALNQV